MAQLFRAFTKIAPTIGPTSVPRPPTATQTTASRDLSVAISLGLMMPTCGHVEHAGERGDQRARTKMKSLKLAAA